jgi:hypothetical protein
MATSKLIAPAFFKQLTEGQILTWRQKTYFNVNKNMEFLKDEILSLDNQSILSLDRIKDLLLKQIKIYNSIIPFQLSNSVFVMVDSCVLGKYTLPKILLDFKKKYNLQTQKIIIIVSQINLTENIYKFNNKEKYPNINFRSLYFNLNLLTGREKFKMDNIILLETDIIFDNKMLFQVETEFLKKNKSWNFRDRNELNDNAQLEMIAEINKMFRNQCFFISKDRNLLKKIKTKPNIISYSYF